MEFGIIYLKNRTKKFKSMLKSSTILKEINVPHDNDEVKLNSFDLYEGILIETWYYCTKVQKQVTFHFSLFIFFLINCTNSKAVRLIYFILLIMYKLYNLNVIIIHFKGCRRMNIWSRI